MMTGNVSAMRVNPDTKFFCGDLEILGAASLEKRGQLVELSTRPRASNQVVVSNGLIGQNFGSLFSGAGSMGSFISIGGHNIGDEFPSLQPITVTPEMEVRLDGALIPANTRKLEVRKGQIYLDDKLWTPPPAVVGQGDSATAAAGPYRELHVDIVGNVEQGLHSDAGNIHVVGDCGGKVNTMSGSVTVEGDVTGGGVNTMSGSIDVSGDVSGSATSMSGSIRVSGDNKKKKTTTQKQTRDLVHLKREKPY